MDKQIRPFGMRDKIGYMFGDFGNDFTFILSSAFMLKFYTDVMGIGAGVVGMLMMAAREGRKISPMDKADVWSGCDFQFFDLPVSICRYAILV